MRRKPSSARVLLAAACFLVLFVVPIRVFAGELIFAQSIDGRSVSFGADGLPGALQAQSFVAANPTLTNSLNSGGWLDVTLPTPFAATGRHFLSVQPAPATGTSGNANLSTKGGRGTYKLTVTNTSKTGYTFDAANSVLTKSIAN